MEAKPIVYLNLERRAHCVLPESPPRLPRLVDSLLLFQRATIAQSQAKRNAAAQKAAARADAAQPETEEDPEED